MENKYVGYIIRTVEYKESDLILTVLTKNELVSILAKGVQKVTSKRKGLTMLYSLCEFEVKKGKSGHLFLSGGQVISLPSNLFSKLSYLLILSTISIYILQINDASLAYDLFVKVISLIKQQVNDQIILLAILNEITRIEGIGLNIESCTNCGRTNNITYFSFDEGGFLCKNCTNLVLDNSLLKQTRILLKINLSNCDKIKVELVGIYKMIIDLFILLEDKTGIKFNTKKMLIDLFKKENNDESEKN